MDKGKDTKVAETKNSSPAEMILSAVKGGGDLDKLDKWLTLQERWEANEARKAYHVAMAAFKMNPPKIEKDKKVGYEKKDGTGRVGYNHASLGNASEKINAELSKHGLSASWIPNQQNGLISITCKITHAMGHSEEATLTAAADPSGSKNSIQAIGSTISYLERYTVLALTGLATSDMDDDGRAAAPATASKKISSEQSQIIQDWIVKVKETPKGLSMPRFLQFMNVKKIEEILESDFQKAITVLKNAANNKGTKK